ncbi:MAG: hypothetical protein IJL30_04640 [Clostridia bacterium]|nr:hypothetical protein [Clostridia bacterium]
MTIEAYNAIKSPIKKSQTHYKILPKAVRANAKADFCIIPLYEKLKFENCEYSLTLCPVMQNGQGKETVVAVRPDKDGALKFSADIGPEQEYNVYLRKPDGERYSDIECFNIYALNDDLFSLRPYRGDMHLHTYGSDGREDALYVVSSYRRVGFDYMAVTDHRNYEPSVRAKAFYDSFGTDMALYHGEEVHPPENAVHMVNFGGSFSVNALIESDKEKYYAEVREIMKTVVDYPDPTAVNEIYMYASCKWVFEKIREGGGISIFCHPYWRVGNGYYISDRLTEYILKKKDYTAYELIGGYHKHEIDSNELQLAKYAELRAQGYRIPIVGVSDSHGCDRNDLMNWYGTIVFAKSTALEDIKQAIKDYKSVAFETVGGEMPRIHGEFRYVAYAFWLLREVFPVHDLFCSAEGALMYRLSIGDKSVIPALDALKGSCAKYLDEIYGKTDF